MIINPFLTKSCLRLKFIFFLFLSLSAVSIFKVPGIRLETEVRDIYNPGRKVKPSLLPSAKFWWLKSHKQCVKICGVENKPRCLSEDTNWTLKWYYYSAIKCLQFSLESLSGLNKDVYVKLSVRSAVKILCKSDFLPM